jgi:hypothetical protein
MKWKGFEKKNGPGVTKIVSLRAFRDREKLRKTFFKAAGIFTEIPNRNRLNASTKSVRHYDNKQTNNQETDRQK